MDWIFNLLLSKVYLMLGLIHHSILWLFGGIIMNIRNLPVEYYMMALT